MAIVVFAERALADLERVADFLREESPPAAENVLLLILDAIDVLDRHPYIGRPVRGALRELVIGHGRSGYVALYRVIGDARRVEILALRHQREAGFGR